MTESEAKANIITYATAEAENLPIQIAKAFDVAIQALEKQMPKKIEKQQWIETKCSCGYTFSKHHGDGYYSIPYENMTAYCPNCGQKLNWCGDKALD